MARRKKEEAVVKDDHTLFLKPEARPLNFFSSGCVMLDCVLGGGFVVGRTANIQGAHSTSKTLVCIEACANFARTFPGGRIIYDEIEAAFDLDYAASMGLPVDRVEFPETTSTVELLAKNLEEVADASTEDAPILYIVDSLDALVDHAEAEQGWGESIAIATKAKAMSTMFRKINRKISKSNLCFIIVSQLRDRLGVTFGKRTTRSGGKALNFYASQVLELKHIKTHVRSKSIGDEKRKLERASGIQVEAHCIKNKIAAPFRKCTFDVVFGFGINDLAACIDFITDTGMQSVSGYNSAELASLKRRSLTLSPEEYREAYGKISEAAVTVWYEVEKEFAPPANKYLLT